MTHNATTTNTKSSSADSLRNGLASFAQHGLPHEAGATVDPRALLKLAELEQLASQKEIRYANLRSTPWHPPRIEDLDDENLAQNIVNHWEHRLGCAVWFVRHTKRGRLIESFASSGAKELLVANAAMAAVASDAAQSSMPIGSNCDPKLPLTPSAILDQVASLHHCHGAISASYPLAGLETAWTVILAWKEDEDYRESLNIACWLDLHGSRLGKTLELWSLARSGRRLLATVEKLFQWQKLPKKWIVATIAIAALMMIVPLHYRPQRNCILEPSSRRYVASPVEGRLASIVVRPGEDVTENQLLATIDDQPIRRELLGAEAELQSANKRCDIALASRASGELRIAQIECRQIQIKIDSLNDQLSRLEIRSPVTGVLVQGDWFGNEGMPVTLGQSLFEIAGLERMTAEIHLLAEDLPWVHVGTKAVIRADSTGIDSWNGTVQRLEPHAEVIDDQAVYVAEIEIDNSHKLFRPGMEARAVVDTGNHTIGWMLLNKPYRWLMNFWIW